MKNYRKFEDQIFLFNRKNVEKNRNVKNIEKSKILKKSKIEMSKYIEKLQKCWKCLKNENIGKLKNIQIWKKKQKMEVLKKSINVEKSKMLQHVGKNRKYW